MSAGSCSALGLFASKAAGSILADSVRRECLIAAKRTRSRLKKVRERSRYLAFVLIGRLQLI